MNQPHVISALVAKRAELSGKLIDLDRQKAALRAQLRHVDHTLAIFGYGDPPHEIAPVRPKVNRFKRRELATFVMGLEREGVKLSNRDAALRMIGAKDWDAGDAHLVRVVTEAIKKAKNWQSRAKL
jgi:hypothetical protein